MSRRTREPPTGARRQASGAVVCLYGALLAWVAVSASCNSAAAVDPSDPVVLSVGVAGSPAGIRVVVAALTTENLTRSGPDGRHLPRLATTWTHNERTLRMQLRSDVTFHDGTPLTAEIVKQRLDAARFDARELPGLPMLRDIDTITVEAPDTLSVHLSRTSALVLDDLANISMRLESDDPGWIGTGPFALEEFGPELTRLTANPSYHGGRPLIDVVEIRNFPTTRNAWAAMMRGEIDFLFDVPEETREFVEAESSVRLFNSDRPYAYAVIFNADIPAFRDARVRIALNHAVDRGAVIERGLRGYGRPSSGIWGPHWLYGADRVYRADPRLANQLLNETGYPMPATESTDRHQMPSRLRFSCLVPEGAPLERIALMVQKQLYDIGVDMALEPVSILELQSRLASGDYEAALAPPNTGRALSRLFAYWDPESTGSDGVLGPSSYPHLGPVFAGLREALSEDERKQAAGELQRVFYDDPPAIFLATRQAGRAVSRRFEVPDDEGDILETLWRWRPASEDSAE